MLVDHRPGTTRDAIDALVERDGKRYVFIDTAGIRRKAQGRQGGERRRVAERALAHPRHRARARGRPDVRRRRGRRRAGREDPGPRRGARARRWSSRSTRATCSRRPTAQKAEENAREKLAFVPYVPDRPHERQDGPRRGGAVHRRSIACATAFVQRVSTGELNRFFEQVLEISPPPTMGGRAPRLYYVTQAEVAPPTFVAMTNAPDSIHFSYRRFVMNQLREALRLRGGPRPRPLQGPPPPRGGRRAAEGGQDDAGARGPARDKAASANRRPAWRHHRDACPHFACRPSTSRRLWPGLPPEMP